MKHSIATWEEEMERLNSQLRKKQADMQYGFMRFKQQGQTSTKSKSVMSYMGKGFAAADTAWAVYKLYRRFSPLLRKRKK